MIGAERRALDRIFHFIGLYLVKAEDPVFLGLSDPPVRVHTVCAQVLHTVQAPGARLGAVLTVSALCRVLKENTICVIAIYKTLLRYYCFTISTYYYYY